MTTVKQETSALPDKEEVLGRFYTLDLEKEGAIFILDRLQKRQHEHELDNEDVQDGENKETKVVVHRREDYEEMIQVLRDSLEREVVVAATLNESSDGSSDSESDDDEDTDSDSDSVEEK